MTETLRIADPVLPVHWLRIARASDRGKVHAFLSRLSPRTVKARYLSSWTSLVGPFADMEAQRLLNGDQALHVVLVAEASGEIRGIGEFAIDSSAHSAEVALVVEDEFQGRGIGRMLYACLEQLACKRGVTAFTGDVAYGNDRVLSLLRRSGRLLRLQPAYGALRLTMGFTSCNAKSAACESCDQGLQVL